MSVQVKLDKIIDALESVSDTQNAYYNRSTGEVICVSEDDFRLAERIEEGEESFDNLPQWEVSVIQDAIDIQNDEDEKYIELPTRYDIDEYSIMEDFIRSIPDVDISQNLASSIRGSGAFRRFKDTIARFGIEDQWYKFRDAEIKRIALEWCQDNEVPFTED